MPKAGDFIKGHYFKGGDPSKEENWIKPPEKGTVKNGFVYNGGNPADKQIRF